MNCPNPNVFPYNCGMPDWFLWLQLILWNLALSIIALYVLIELLKWMRRSRE